MRAPTEQSIAAGEVLLSVEDVSLSFGGVKAVSDVSFDIRKGEIRAIIGPNGAGKTSMLNIINGFYQPQHGRITFKGETRSKMRPNEAARGGMARTFQNVALFKGMTALDNLMAGRTLQGKTIGYIYFDGGYGLEPIPLLDQFAKDFGFTVKKYPVPPADMQNQSGLWLNVRRDRPNWMIMWGWGAMNPTAVKEAAKINYPMDRFVGIWWSGSDDDARPAGEAGKGYLSLNFNNIGADYPAIQDIVKHVIDKGKSQTPKDKVGENFYNRGVYNSVLVAEAIRNAQRITGKKAVTGEDVRRGFEAIEISADRWKELGLPNFGAPIEAVSCSDHNGHHSAFMQQWDGTKWVKVSDWIQPMKDRVRPLLEAAAKDYVSKNQPWPARTEACDKST